MIYLLIWALDLLTSARISIAASMEVVPIIRKCYMMDCTLGPRYRSILLLHQ